MVPRATALGILLGIGLASAVAACFGPGLGPGVVEDEREDVGAGAGPPDAGAPDEDAGPTDPHGPTGIDPPHGSFAGGQRAVVRGSRFGADAKVWFGEIAASDVIALSSTRLQVTTPPGEPGEVDVTTEVGGDPSTRRTLERAYTYDRFHLEPDDGPTSGGTLARIVGRGTSWHSGVSADIGGVPCVSLEVVGPEELVCETPASTLGAKAVRVGAGDDRETVLDAFTYDDAPEGVLGGLSGDPLDGSIEVRVFSNATGEPIPGATVVLGESIGDAILETTGDDGRAIVEDGSLVEAVTVTVALRCHHPVTFVDVPVGRVHAYLDPVLDISCISEIQIPPPSGSADASIGTVKGQLHWGYTGEFERGPWGVPAPGPGERRAAYVFAAGGSPTATFSLPPEDAATTEASEGDIGYGFELEVPPGNRVLYAFAGLEDRSAPVAKFVPWSIGVLRGVVVAPDVATEDVAIDMRTPLEHALELQLEPPAPTPEGPDRLVAHATIRLGTEGYVIFPQGRTPRLLPFEGPLDVVGVPLLTGQLAGSTYVVSARAATGPALLLPVSVVARAESPVAGPIEVGPFVGVPRLVAPTAGGAWDGTSIELEIGGGGSPIDVLVVDVAKPSEIVKWRVVAPGSRTSMRVPDLRQIGLGLPQGDLRFSMTAGRLFAGFDYGELAYRDMRQTNMNAYAADFVDAHW
jgi:hypothetical protein